MDAGEIIERREISISKYDTFHSVAGKIYENEIDMLVGALEKIDEEHRYIIPENELYMRMPNELEKELFDRFEMLKYNSMHVDKREV